MASMAAILKTYFASSPALKGELTWNLVGSIGATCRLKVAKIIPLVCVGGGAILKIYLAKSSPEPKGQWLVTW